MIVLIARIWANQRDRVVCKDDCRNVGNCMRLLDPFAHTQLTSRRLDRAAPERQ